MDQHTCGGDCCGHHDHDHHHGPSAGQVIDGPIEAGRFVQVSYRLTAEDGTLLDESDRIDYLHGSQQIVSGLERALEGKSAGDHVEVTLSPEDAYGERDDGRMMDVPLDSLPEGVKPGVTLEAQLPDGRLVPLTVVKVEAETATLDSNHPLAGKTLCFDVRVLSVHEAVAAE